MSRAGAFLARLKSLYEISHSHHEKMRAMEGLRGFAVLLVFFVHYVSTIRPWVVPGGLLERGLALVHSLGNAGVDLFFVLSGYLIYGSLIRRPQPFFPYLKRRVQRIYPTFTVVFVIYLVLSMVFPQHSKIPDGLWDALAYVLQNYLLLPGMFDIEPIITVAWSLSYEFFFYLSVPFIIYVLSLRNWTRASRSLLIVALCVFIFVWPSAVGGHVRLTMFCAMT
jgi:peptidoglycan/LPS O-acetylase OafA/YrhL